MKYEAKIAVSKIQELENAHAAYDQEFDDMTGMIGGLQHEANATEQVMRARAQARFFKELPNTQPTNQQIPRVCVNRFELFRGL